MVNKDYHKHALLQILGEPKLQSQITFRQLQHRFSVVVVAHIL